MCRACSGKRVQQYLVGISAAELNRSVLARPWAMCAGPDNSHRDRAPSTQVACRAFGSCSPSHPNPVRAEGISTGVGGMSATDSGLRKK